MKTSKTSFLCMLISCVLLSTKAQGTLKNLDFEQATIVPLDLSQQFYSASNALPYWTVYFGNSPVNYVLYDNVTIGSPAVSIHDSLSALQPLQGNYSVVLQHSSGGPPTSAAIGQTGQLPQDVASIVFYVASYQTLQVTFAGNSISLVQLGTTASYSIYGGDIATYAGQTGELLFTDIASTSQPMMLDSIQFSTQPIPEPSVFGLLALSGLLFCLRRQRNSAR